jgi:molybdopterin molybdotransferase
VLRYSAGMGKNVADRETIAIDEAQRRILAACAVLPARAHPLDQACGLFLAERVVASADSPRFDTSAMDGFAVQAADLHLATFDHPVRLPVGGEIPAGEPATVSVAPGVAVRIMTGAEIPIGADAVVPFELVRELPGSAEFVQPIPEGANLRRSGEDVRAGDLLLEPGLRLVPGHLGLIAGDGRAEVVTHPRPRVALITTGDELVEPGIALEPGQIWDSNSSMLGALMEQFGGALVARERVPDDAVALAAALNQAAARADLVVTVGSASRGDHDVFAQVAEPGIEAALWDVRIKPGRPLVFGSIRGVPLIGLPGNPVAAFVSAVQFARPAIVTMLGRFDVDPPTVPARVEESFANPGGRRTFARVVLEQDRDGFVARLAGPQNVANLRTLSRADGLLVIPETTSHVEPGSVLDVQMIADL